MVLEAFAAVGLANSICQFVDFSSRLFSTATSIHRSATGAPVDIQRLDEITKALQEWTQKLASHRSRGLQQGTLDANRNLYRLGENCESAAEELLTVTNALRIKKTSSKWTTFKVALAAVWSESKIKGMEERLTSYRLQMILELELLQSNGQDSIIELLDNLAKTNQQMGASLTDQISKMRNELKSAIGSLKDDLTNLSQQSIVGETTRASRLDLERCEHVGYDIAQSLNVLNDLRFEHMDSRHAKITEVHPKTYEWIFEEKFQEWARSAESIFWISGKPGSGKSTLMRYLVDNERTPDLFKDWCSEHKLVIATYFFWINDTPLQRSQEGLLRALLYDILRQCPEQIQKILPQRWRDAESTGNSFTFVAGRPWTRDELLTAYRRLCSVGAIDTKFCIFIDGLDEYEGDHEDLIETVQALQKFGIKLCVASRPWNVFEEAFGSDRARKIYMQELNRADMQRFVNDRLGSHRNFAALPVTEAEAIASETVDKAQGVFLWVHLVVRSLLEGLRNRDSIGLLRKRLETFPSDLNKFFKHIFDSLDPTYRMYLAHMFQIALLGPRDPIAYWFLDVIEENPDVALTLPVQKQSFEDTAKKIQEVTIRVNGRSKGLMEVHWVEGTRIEDHDMLGKAYHTDAKVQAQVDFLHRTVRDFLVVKEIQDLLEEWQQSKFEPSLVVCKMLLADFKYTSLMERFRDDPSTVTRLLAEFLFTARGLEHKGSRSAFIYLDNLDKALRLMLDQQEFVPGRELRPPTWQSHGILELAAAYGLELYVRMKLTEIGKGDEYKIGLIDFALMSSMGIGFEYSYRIFQGELFGMVTMLYRSLADPTRHKHESFLAALRPYMSFHDSKYIEEGLKVLLESAVISHDEFQELKAMGESGRHSSRPALRNSPSAPQHPQPAPEQSLERWSTARETLVDQKADSAVEAAAQQGAIANTSTLGNPKAASGTSKRKSIRLSFKGMISKLS